MFVLSFRERDTLAAAAARAGWRPIAARRDDDVAARFAESRARVMMVDARHAFDQAIAAMREVAALVETGGAALLVLIARGDVVRLDDVFAAGATHYLAAPFGEAEILQALRFADRHAQRIAGGESDPPALREPSRASLDQLTGLDDGHVAARWIEGGLAQDGLAGPILILLAASRFEMVNAAFGSATGDALLRSAARRIERIVVRPGERGRLVARIAGAEFLVGLPPGATPKQASLLAEALVEALCRPFVAGERVVTLAWNVGMVIAEDSDRDAASLIRRAGTALSDAKASESGAIRLRRSGDEGEGTPPRQLEIDLRAALDQDEIELLYQPQVSITTGAIVAVEALARWRHPHAGELGAETLFAAAERSDYLVQLSDHVQRKAIEQVAAWPASLGDLRVAINITAADIVRPGYDAILFALIDGAGVDRARITVEVTESGLIDDLGAAASLLAALRAGGLRVAIDDFGTGYSSLAYLKALPLDLLKIDKRLSQDIGGSERDRVVVRSVIEMARSLDLAVVAEGVETEQQLALLAREGCNYYQGFLCAPPVDAGELERLMADASR